MRENNEQEYRLLFIELLMAIKEKMMILIAVTMIGAILGWGIASFLITPKYEASINMIVTTQMEPGGYVTNDNISSAQNLVDTYAIIIKSNIVLDDVNRKLGLGLSYDQLYEKVDVNAINETQVMKVSVQDENLDKAKKIVEKIAEIAPSTVEEVVEAGTCKVISYVEASEKPVSPKVINYIAVSGFLAVTICIAIILVNVLKNDYIVDETDVERELGIYTLGIIPDVGGK